MAQINLYGEDQTPSFGTRGFRQVNYTCDSLYRVKAVTDGNGRQKAVQA